MRRSSLLIIFLVVFLDLVGFGIVIPILPYYAQHYGGSGWEIGWLMASYSLMQFLFSPVWGRISDHIGRRPVLLISILGTCVSMTLLGLAGSLKWLFIARVLAGIGSANISTAYAYVTDVTTEENRAKGMGLIGAGFGLGFIFGPAIGGLLSRYGYDMPMFAAAGLGFVNLIFAYFKLEEPRVTRETRAANRTKRFDPETIRLALEDGRAKFAVGVFLLVTFAVTQLEVTFALYMSNRYGYDAETAGFLLAVMGVVMVAVQGGLIGKLVSRFGEPKLVIYGTALCAGALTLFALTSSLFVVVVSLVFLALGHGALHPSLSAIASKGAAPQRRGATMGVFQSAGSLARVIGPPVAGWLFDRMSWRSPFFGGAVVLAFASSISFVWWRRNSGAKTSPVES